MRRFLLGGRIATVGLRGGVMLRLAKSNAVLAAAITSIVGFSAFFSLLGADSRWLAALGQTIVRQRAIPRGIPFAAAPSGNWHNVPVLGELSFHGLEALLGNRGLMLAQLIAVTVAFVVMARDAAGPGGRTAGALLIAALGSLGSLVVIRSQLFSLGLFPLLIALLRREARRPSARIWLVPPLIALWGNLHGAVLVGLVVALTYLLVDRIRVGARTALLVSLASAICICVTPAGFESIAYYRGVLGNVAAERRIDLWAMLSLRNPLDVLTIGAAAILIAMILRRRSKPQLWELLAIAGLGALTVDAGRSGLWLILFLAPLAARGEAQSARSEPWPLAALLGLGLAALACYSVARGPMELGASHRLIEQTIQLAHGSPILAEDTVAEQIAFAGGRIWLGNPIDAFSKRDQALYLDWLAGKPAGRAALAKTRVAAVHRSSPALALLETSPAFRLVARDREVLVFERKT